MKLIATLLIGGGVFYLLNESTATSWSRTGSFAVTRAYRGALLRAGDLHVFRLALEEVGQEPRFRDMEIPEEHFGAVQAGDRLEFTLRSFPLLGLEQIDFRIFRETREVLQWREGYVVFWGGLGLFALGVGLAGMFILAFMARVFGLGKAVDV